MSLFDRARSPRTVPIPTPVHPKPQGIVAPCPGCESENDWVIAAEWLAEDREPWAYVVCSACHSVVFLPLDGGDPHLLERAYVMPADVEYRLPNLTTAGKRARWRPAVVTSRNADKTVNLTVYLDPIVDVDLSDKTFADPEKEAPLLGTRRNVEGGNKVGQYRQKSQGRMEDE